MKAEAILMLAGKASEGGDRGKRQNETEKMLSLARQAADCTIPEGWATGRNLAEFLLAPGELEPILLVSAALLYRGNTEEAWELQQTVWK